MASVSVPGSKSVTIRAMACAALANGRSHLYGALQAEDTEAMIRALRSFGVAVNDTTEPWAIDGLGGHLKSPTDVIDVGESGLTARIAMVLATLADGATTIDGRGRLRERPIGGLVDTLIAQGVSLATEAGGLPVTINGQGGLWGGPLEVDCAQSSQYATAVLIGAPLASQLSTVKLTGLEGSEGYLDLTVDVIEAFGGEVERTITGYDVPNTGYRPADYLVEPDISAAVYPMVAAAITGGRAELPGVRVDSRQPDINIVRLLGDMGCRYEDSAGGLIMDCQDVVLKGIVANLSGSPDGALALVVACLFAEGESELSGLFSLRHKESDRLQAISTEIGKLGADVDVIDDTLVIRPTNLTRGDIDPHGDHRLAMSLALIGLVVPGIRVTRSEVVNKTWPGFWDMLEDLVED